MSRWKENDCVGCPQGCIYCGRQYDYYVFECDRCGKTSSEEYDYIHDGDNDYCKDCWEEMEREEDMRVDGYCAKAIDNETHDWVTGGLVVQDWKDNFVFIIEKFEGMAMMDMYELLINKAHIVEKDTICRSTGCRDADGELVFEHDILRDDKGNKYKCRWIVSDACFELKGDNGISYEMGYVDELVVIGNEFDRD